MIDSMKLKNFKAFKDSGNIDLKKINIFIGANSSGKSSFIKSLTLLKEATESKNCKASVRIKKGKTDYKDLTFKKNVENKITFKLSFENRLEKNNYKKVHIDENLKMIKCIEFTLNIGEGLLVEKLIIEYGEEICEIKVENEQIIAKIGNEQVIAKNIIKPYKFYYKIDPEDIKNIYGKDLKLINKLKKILDDLEKKLEILAERLIHIKSFKNRMPNAEENGYNFIEEETLIESIDKVSKEKIVYWLEEFELGDKIEIKNDGNKEKIYIRNKNLNIYNRLQDMGFGTRQLLPIIIGAIKSSKESLIILEEPETHIYPKAQSKLANLFTSIAMEDDKRFIIETHSIFLVTGLQILVAEGKIKNSDIGVYYVNQDHEGSKIKKMNIKESGQFEDEWPSGFFDIHYLLGKKLFKLL